MSGFKVNINGVETDLDDIFAPIGTLTPIADTGFKTVDGKDLSERYAPRAAGDGISFPTEFISTAHAGDLKNVFAKIGTISTAHSTSTSNYFDYSTIGFDYNIKDKDNNIIDPMSFESFVIELSDTSDMSNIIQSHSVTHTDLGFTNTEHTGVYMFRDLQNCSSYYSHLKFTDASGTPGRADASSVVVTNPCGTFAAERHQKVSGNGYEIKVTTTPNTNVTISADKDNTNPLRCTIRPIANDEDDSLYLAVGESFSFNCASSYSQASGKVILDPAFPKFYNYHWNDWVESSGSVYSDTAPGGFAYFVNALNYCSQNRPVKTKKVLYINDDARDRYKDSHHGLGTHTYAFNTTVENLTSKAGYDLNYLNGEDRSPLKEDEYISGKDWPAYRMQPWVIDETWNSHLTSILGRDRLGTPISNPRSKAAWDALFDDYDCIVWISCTTFSGYDLNADFKNALLDYIDTGGGLLLLCDHDAFQYNANNLIKHFGVQFYGNIDRTPLDNAYKVSTILGNSEYIRDGWHPLFDNIPNTSRFFAGASEGKIRYVDTFGLTTNKTTDANGEVTFDIGSTTGKVIVRDSNDCGVIMIPRAAIKYFANWVSGKPGVCRGKSRMFTNKTLLWDESISDTHVGTGYWLQKGGDDSLDITYISGAMTWEQARLDSIDKGGQLAVIKWSAQGDVLKTHTNSNSNTDWLGGTRIQYRDGSQNDGGDIDYDCLSGRQYLYWSGSSIKESDIDTSNASRIGLTLIPSGHNSGTVQPSYPYYLLPENIMS